MAAAMRMAKAENFMMEVWEEGKEAVYVGERAREREGEGERLRGPLASVARAV